MSGDAVNGSARLLGSDAGPLVQRLLRKKYGWLKRSLDAFNGLVRVLARNRKQQAEYIQILPRAAERSTGTRARPGSP